MLPALITHQNAAAQFKPPSDYADRLSSEVVLTVNENTDEAQKEMRYFGHLVIFLVFAFLVPASLVMGYILTNPDAFRYDISPKIDRQIAPANYAVPEEANVSFPVTR